jgi:hypothetical protein
MSSSRSFVRVISLLVSPPPFSVDTEASNSRSSLQSSQVDGGNGGSLSSRSGGSPAQHRQPHVQHQQTLQPRPPSSVDVRSDTSSESDLTMASSSGRKESKEKDAKEKKGVLGFLRRKGKGPHV